jgi:predicted metal-dependent peptidase
MAKREDGAGEARDESWPELISAAQTALSRATIALLRKEQFFGHILASMPRHFTDKIDTMAVVLRGNGIQLVTNPRFFMSRLRSLDQRTAVLKHEVLHVVFKHLFRSAPAGKDHLLWNIAADLVVNQYIAPFRLPEGAIQLSTFPDLGLEANDTMENYFAMLKQLRDGAGKKGQASVSPLSARALSEMERNQKGFPTDHSGWGDGARTDIDGEPSGSSIPRMVMDAISKSLENQILAAHGRSVISRVKLPSWLERVLDEIRERNKPKVDWRRVLRIFASSGRRTRIRATMMKESRRFEGISGARRPPGTIIRPQQRLAVVIDTSGSIDDAQLRTFFDEIQAIFRQGADITVVECDDEVRNSYRYEGVVPTTLGGGGGTSFEPAMQWLHDRKNGRFDACIYLTDGAGCLPATRPPCQLLWVLSAPGDETRMPFGRQVTISGQ